MLSFILYDVINKNYTYILNIINKNLISSLYIFKYFKINKTMFDKFLFYFKIKKKMLSMDALSVITSI